MQLPLTDRIAAGRALGERLVRYRGARTLVLGLPRGGVPVADEIARLLDAELDVWIVRKIGAPGQEELAIGAVASGGVRFLNRDIVRILGVSDAEIERLTARQLKEVERRERAYRGDRPPVEVRDRTVILVDDGIATGATMLAALQAVRKLAPSRLIVAVGVAPPEMKHDLASEADEVVCLAMPEPFVAVGRWYRRFDQVTDDEVRAALQTARRRSESGGSL
jgi:putative phosphoribosyl transferase